MEQHQDFNEAGEIMDALGVPRVAVVYPPEQEQEQQQQQQQQQQQEEPIDVSASQ